MGNCGTKTFGTRFSKREYISEKSLLAVRMVIDYLKEVLVDVLQRDIFRATGHDARAQQVAKELNRGGSNLAQILEECSARDVASGLMFFLIYLKKPLVPPAIQSIVLDPDNKCIPPEVVAQDVLGLLQDEIKGRQFLLLQYILDLLNHVLKYTPTDELSGSTVPIYMMPIFFNLRSEHMLSWRRVAIIFVEMIRLAPQELNIRHEIIGGDPRNEMINPNRAPGALNTERAQRLQDLSIILRRFLEDAGNSGDGSHYEYFSRRCRNVERRLHSL